MLESVLWIRIRIQIRICTSYYVFIKDSKKFKEKIQYFIVLMIYHRFFHIFFSVVYKNVYSFVVWDPVTFDPWIWEPGSGTGFFRI
jgi:hypothetical protein